MLVSYKASPPRFFCRSNSNPTLTRQTPSRGKTIVVENICLRNNYYHHKLKSVINIMANKTYTIILNSAVATNVNTSAGISAYTYYVNWGSFLPKHVRTFSCKATFRSNKTTTEADTPDTAIVYANFGARTIYDQTNTMSQMVCIIQPDAYFITSATVRLYYFTAIAPQFMCPYPSNDFVTIRIKTLGGENTPSPPYIITFEFTEIENI